MSFESASEIIGIVIGIVLGVIIVCYCMTCLCCSSSDDSSKIKKKIKLKGPRKVWAHKKYKSHSFSLDDEDVEYGNDGNYEINKEDVECCEKGEQDTNCCDDDEGNDGAGCGEGDDGGGDSGGGGCDSGCGGGDEWW